MALKTQLNNKLNSTANQEEKKQLLKYYISTWGGIVGYLEETMNKYTHSTNEQLIALGSNGIASWSKALCIKNPANFAIFDARVSAALNALQIINHTEASTLYPVLTSKNNVIKKGNELFKRTAKNSDWEHARKCTFYNTYLRYLKNTASSSDKKDNVSIATIEMLLFAKAEELVKQAFPNEKF